MACPRVGMRARCQPGGRVSIQTVQSAYDDRDEACIGVVRDGAKEGVLVHVRRREERGATLVHDYNNLHTPLRAGAP